MSRTHLYLLPLLAVALLSTPAQAEVRLPAVFGHHMVLQRDQPIPVWRTAEPGEIVIVSFARHQVVAEVDRNGSWQLQLPALPASATPRTFQVAGTNTITFEDVLEACTVAIVLLGSTGGTAQPFYPTTVGAYDTTFDGPSEVFLTRLRTDKVGAAQLGYSTYLGGQGDEDALAMHLAAGAVTGVGWVDNGMFPMVNPYDSTWNGASNIGDALIFRFLLPPLPPEDTAGLR